jgi:hypothetical protein
MQKSTTDTSIHNMQEEIRLALMRARARVRELEQQQQLQPLWQPSKSPPCVSVSPKKAGALSHEVSSSTTFGKEVYIRTRKPMTIFCYVYPGKHHDIVISQKPNTNPIS